MKICGISRVEDALYAESCGAWAIGVILCSDSPREVSFETASKIFSSLSPSTLSVAVTHTEEPGDLEQIFALRPGAIQLYHPLSILPRHQVRIFRVARRNEPLPMKCDGIVIDDSHGTGRGYNRSFACEVAGRSALPVILAGGLTPENVQGAINLIHPYAVDVCSGVEHSPGVKDWKKIHTFLTLCQEYGS